MVTWRDEAERTQAHGEQVRGLQASFNQKPVICGTACLKSGPKESTLLATVSKSIPVYQKSLLKGDWSIFYSFIFESFE